ncbi:FAD-binding protein [Microbacterium sp. HD4P20]|uniref:D-arabinono-1,4-lactone oxidase n=1 Tax=Microbacterium sp. HD4P20 TaxID=2864874 RepID=UPI001C644058|nr:D-arabinono-1,4-lactone oxidase [Microbacterium sp. HD4P20]MCP2635470.1 FAD-binding protein [Microbacterium sp. HD4P20]
MSVATGTIGERNWASNLVYGSERILAPRSIEELADAVRSASRVKALGSRHCFNTIADTDGVHIVTRELPAEVAVDSERRVVRVAAGLRYGDVAPRLDSEGWALANLASLPHISLAGAVATGTHGSGDAVASLAASVAAVELVTADGQTRRFARGEADFDGVVVSLGALGVVTALELDIVPTFDIAQTVYERLPLDAVLDDLDAVTGLGYSVSMFHTWRDPAVVDQLWVKRRADAAGTAPAEVLGSARSAVKRHPLPDVSAASCTDQLGEPGPWFARLPHFKLEFTPSNGDELQSEYLVPRRNAVAAISALRELAPRVAPLLQVCELRTVARDDLWLSPASETDVLGLHFTWKPDQPGVEALLPTIEAALAPLEARPHWGKLFTLEGADQRMPQLYPRWNDFAALRDRLDPRGVFRNDFLARLGL